MATHTLDPVSFPPPPHLPLGLRLNDAELMHFAEQNRPHRFERDKNGEIVVMSPVGGTSSLHEALVFSQLYQWNFTARTGIVFAPNAGFNLSDGSCLAPDAAWLDQARWAALTPVQQAGFPPLCPDFVIEVRSQSDTRKLLEVKMQLWLDNGAKVAWLVDPVDGNLSIYRAAAAAQTLYRPDRLAAHAPVAGFVLDCSGLWTAE